ncbi:CRP-like cAMP-binding protein [Arcticibacter pallidicorallinus]|uniref:CRP-like cAMP-binding protein n=1 Tax=Arcticibacter pallidicorallinus TaxID=1259464 RepID=A0A2T0TS79_9SPHI|nr:Crp/Fnr family transcriptional regulator [Arcticibacter pallidicorallinus]PRY48564.1 CRP-like cAMP-binding protein [Arcticibacter pallidicorallinus]
MRNHPLIQKLSEFGNLSDEVIAQILDALKLIELPKEKVVLREGFTNRNIYFLETGIVRRYNISQVGHQKTTGFIPNCTFFTDLDSFERRKASNSTFNTETSCVIYSLDYFKLKALLDANSSLRELVTIVKEHYSRRYIQTKDFLATEPIEKRVKMLVDELPMVMDTCRKRDIVSYLRTNSQTYNFTLKNLLQSGKK